MIILSNFVGLKSLMTCQVLGLSDTKFQSQSHQPCSSCKENFKSITIYRHEARVVNLGTTTKLC